jgi:alpha-tubulin suppressor-like RCC1 family protein
VLKKSGILFAVGLNNVIEYLSTHFKFGQLGVGDTVHRSSPSRIQNMDSNVDKFYAGVEHSTVIKNGTAFLFGRNDVLKIGLNTNSMDNWV